MADHCMPLSKEDLIELWRRIFPRFYTVPIEEEAGGRGFDAYSQMARVFERISEAIATTAGAYYLKPHSEACFPISAGASCAVGTVEISRAAPAVGEITLIAGTEVRGVQFTARGEEVRGEIFRLLSDVVIAAGSLGGATVNIEALRCGYQGNVPAGRITGFLRKGRYDVVHTVAAGNVVTDDNTCDRFTPFMVGRYVVFISGPNVGTVPRRILSVTPSSPDNSAVLDGVALTVGAGTLRVVELEDLGLEVSNASETTGGAHAFLDAIGFDRALGRRPGESDPSYRDRLCNLADIISPCALDRIADRVLGPCQIPYMFCEGGDPNCLPGLFLDYDPLDDGDFPGNGKVLMSVAGLKVFYLCVGVPGLLTDTCYNDVGFPYDSPYPDNAWDLPESFGNTLDGYPIAYAAIFARLYNEIDRARAAGIGFVMCFDESL